MEHEILANASPSFHPAMIESIEGFEDYNGAFKFVADTLGKTYKREHQTATLAQEIKGNASLSEAEQILQVDDVREKHCRASMGEFLTTRGTLEKIIQDTENELNRTVESKALGYMNKEIREHVKGLSDNERFSFLSKAIKENDINTVSSILGAPAYLSGLTDKQKSLYTKSFRDVSNPGLNKKLNIANKCLEQVSARLLHLEKSFDKAADLDKSKVLRVRNARYQANAAIKAAS